MNTVLNDLHRDGLCGNPSATEFRGFRGGWQGIIKGEGALDSLEFYRR